MMFCGINGVLAAFSNRGETMRKIVIVAGLLLGAWIGQRARGVLRRAGGLVVAALGVLFVLRGLGVHAPL